jgi:hypothetical protein
VQAYCLYSNAGYHDIHEKRFDTQKEAVEVAEASMKRYRFVWLSELGEYQTRKGKWITGPVYYWWSSAVSETDWGGSPDAGYGRPADSKHLAPYRPLLYKAKRFAHLNVRALPTCHPGEQTPRS